MRFPEYAKQHGHGIIRRLSRASGVGAQTIAVTAKGKLITKYLLAKAISQATDGVVSIAELCDPDPLPSQDSELDCECSKVVTILTTALSDIAHELTCDEPKSDSESASTPPSETRVSL